MFLEGDKLANVMPFVLDVITEGVFIVEGNKGNYPLLQANLAVRKVFGIQNVVTGQPISKLISAESNRWLMHQFSKVSRFHEIVEEETTVKTLSGEKHISLRLMPIIGEKGIDYIIGTVRMLSDDLRVQNGVRQKHERYATALEHAPYGVCFIGDDGRPSMVNRALCQWLDIPLNFIMKSNLADFFSEIDRSVFNQALEKVIKGGRSYRGIELKLKPVSGKCLWVSLSMSRVADVENPYTIVQFVDITKQKEEEQELLKLATQDHLTKLSNRKVFDENLAMSIKQAKRYSRQGAVVYIDLDKFKDINDNYGHKAGDMALVEVAKVLKDVFRETDTVARIGGDEFAVIMNEADAEEAKRKANIVEQKIANLRIIAHGQEVRVGASMGVQVFNERSNLSKEDLVAAADKAMYAKKAESKMRSTTGIRLDA